MRNKTILIDFENGEAFRCFVDGSTKKIVTTNDRGYIRCQIDSKTVYLHRFIYTKFFGEVPDGMQVDHIDGDKKNNRISNLRLVTNKQNQENRQGAQKNSGTGIKGVSWHKTKNKYMAAIKANKKQIYLGYFDRIEDAKTAYAVAASKYHTHNPSAL